MKKQFRILKNREFQLMTKKCKFIKNKYFVLYYKRKEEINSRCGISVSKKIGIAVIRNRVKRQVKSIVTQSINFNEFIYDFTIYPRQQYKIENFEQMQEALNAMIKELGGTK